MTTVVLFIYKRPKLTDQVFHEIRKAKPETLLVVADGPKNPGEVSLCQEARAIIERVDWDCRVLKNYSDINLGCKKRISTGLDWVFEHYEDAIILEDDCLPDHSFFRYCTELLEYYQNEPRVGVISGDNFQSGNIRGSASYYYSNYVHVWGWATWRRVWQNYDINMSNWPIIRDSNLLYEVLGNFDAVSYWKNMFDLTYSGAIDTWDYQLLYTCWLKKMFTILPNVNLVSNIGFGKHATHLRRRSPYINIPTQRLNFPLTHPQIIKSDIEADNFTFSTHYQERKKPWFWKITGQLRKTGTG